jgi:hypothetical protein
VPIHRHFHVIHNEARALPPSASAFLQALNEAGATLRRRGRVRRR